MSSVMAGPDKRRSIWLILGIVLIAFILRLYRLDYFSLRGDEAFDVLYAAQPVPEIILQDRFYQIYPPLYHTSLHYWMLIAGRGEFALRWITGVVPGTLVVPLTYALALRLFAKLESNPPEHRYLIGWVAGVLAAVNPFLIWWSQDAHFYALLAMFGAAITLLATRLWDTRGRRPVWLAYVLITALGFYTHYYTYFSWGAVNLVALRNTIARRWTKPLVIRWWLAQVVAVTLYSPWLVASFDMVNAYVEPWIEHTGLFEILWRNLLAYSLHMISKESWARVVAILAGAVFAIGSLPWRWRPGRPTDQETRRLFTVLILIFVPLLVLYIGSLQRPLYDEKLTIFVLPLFLIGLARGLIIIWHRKWLPSALAGFLLIGSMLFSDYFYYVNLIDVKSPAWREMMEFVHQKAQARDLLIQNFPESSLLYYNDDELPSVLIPDRASLSTDEISVQLQGSIAGYRRIWLVPLVRPWWDARGDVQAWLDRHTERVDQRFFRGVHVSLYLAPIAWKSAMTPQPNTFADGVRLVGFRLPGGADKAGAQSRQEPTQILLPGDTLHLTLYWQAGRNVQTSYTVFTHLVGPDGQLYGQWDNPPVRGTYPTTDWTPGEHVVDQYEIPVSLTAPPGKYQLLIGLYDSETGARLPVLDDEGSIAVDHVRLEGVITVY